MSDSRYQRMTYGVWDFQTRTNVLPNTAEWSQYEIWLTSGGVPLPMDSIGQQDLGAAQAARISEINAHAASLRNKIIQGRSAGELASWAMKLLDALAIQAGEISPFVAIMPQVASALGLPMVPKGINHAMALVRGCTEEEYLAKVLRDGTSFITAEILLDAVRGKHCDAISVCTTVQEVILYDWGKGWPSI